MTVATGDPRSAFEVRASDSLREAAHTMTRAFEASGSPSAALDARFLLQGILNCDAATLLRDSGVLVGAHAARLNAAMARRLNHEPVARILGEREFYGRSFRITPDVLDPRPDTETLVDLVLDIVRAESRFSEAVTICDIGVGSGAIIATLLAELPQARGIATDVSAAALAVARDNAVRIGVAARLTLIEGAGLPGPADTSALGGLDIVVSNPPYIPAGEIAALADDVKHFDPRLALDGGQDGLSIYREIAGHIASWPSIKWLCVEVGHGQSTDVERIFSKIGATPRWRRSDLGGQVRAVALELQR